MRAGIPKQLDEDDNINEDYLKYLSDIQICYDLVDIARGVLEKEDLQINLHLGDQAYTDGTTVSVPKRSSKRRILTKHELAHIYFESSLELRAAFAEAMVDRLYPLSKIREKRIEEVSFLVNIFDDGRVNSLWSEVWPGDGTRFRGFYSKEGKKFKKDFMRRIAVGGQISLVEYTILRSIGQEISCKWNHLSDEIEEASREVRLQTFKGMLVRIKILLEKLLENQEENSVSVQSLPLNLGTAPPVGCRVSDSAREEIESLLNQDEEEEEDFLLEEEDSMLDKLEEIIEALNDLHRVDVPKRPGAYSPRVVKAQKQDLLPTEWTSEMRQEAYSWASMFRSIVGAKTRSLDVEGDVLDHVEYLQGRLSKSSVPCYTTQATGVGFDALMLVDMSGSMQGSFHYVNRLYAVLCAALSLPFVKIKAVGFRTSSGSRLDLIDFDESAKSVLSHKYGCGGLTPTNLALENARTFLPDTTSERHLFLLTDGLPYENNRDEKVVYAEVSRNRKSLQDAGINCHTFLLGEYAAKAKEENIDKMFGVNCWQRVSEETLYRDGFNFLAKLFVDYVNRTF